MMDDVLTMFYASQGGSVRLGTMETDLRPWLADTLDFIIDQLNRAKRPTEQVVAVDAIEGLLFFIRG